ncbi:phosphotransferase [Actinomadura rubrisoli]|uniref:Aminoglycoside phosphotransferase n=1 Tax=Actinomadura rubrisoli TaxID=2530368 RepID=A0A4R5B983_9ACTN|nr:phosphotransferase [Actinomadura rubrisoli]TDD79912.1 aminoglycoside phosphotransferase [Actinomadura rubrisoli]
MRSTWDDLPGALRDAVQEHSGPVRRVESAAGGGHADFASTLHVLQGPVFVKAARKLPDEDGAEVRALRREAAINQHVSGLAPRLLWTAEAGGWLALGFEHVEGRHADYAPGSADLALLTRVVRAIQALPCPDVVQMRVERRWEAVAADVSSIAGNALLHTDLNPRNLLITSEGRVYVVDWAFASRGAPWVEAGQVVPWLIRAGHTPRQAERWAESIPSWDAADPAAIGLYARASAERWRRYGERAHGGGAVPEYVAVAQRWAEYRVSR